MTETADTGADGARTEPPAFAFHANPYFGRKWDAPATDNARQAETPVGTPCYWCEVPVEDGDRGFLIPGSRLVAGEQVGVVDPIHRECQLRAVTGSTACMAGTCTCRTDPACADLTPQQRRAEALEVWRSITGDGSERYLLWSHKHSRWWLPARNGYTELLADAGVYPAKAAAEICAKSVDTWRHQRLPGDPPTVMIPAPDYDDVNGLTITQVNALVADRVATATAAAHAGRHDAVARLDGGENREGTT